VSRAFQAASLAVFALLMGLLGGHVASRLDGPGALWVLAMAAFLALLVVDFISGLVHWFCDTYFQEDTPVLGPLLIQPFREHHRAPLAITRRSFVQVNGNNCAAALPVLAVAVWTERNGSDAESSLLGAGFVWFFAWAVYWTNTFHKWAHAPRPPAAAAWLQRARLAISRRRHALHHREGDRAYCITTGWLNPLLDRARFFRGLERAVAALSSRGRGPRGGGGPRLGPPPGGYHLP
jgi:ubiquitin-conjugating enzyme E2 variant